MKRYLWMLCLLLVGPASLAAQDARALLRSALAAHGVTTALPTDIVAAGTITRDAGRSEPYTVYVQGNRIRYEIGTRETLTVSIFAGTDAWVSSGQKVRSLQLETSKRRPSLFPFLDLITEVNNPNAEVTYRGAATLGLSSVQHVSVRLPNPVPQPRSWRGIPDEEVDLYLDPQTLAIMRSERLRTAEDNLELRVPSVLEFADYRNVNGLAVPFRIVNTSGTAEHGLHRSVVVWDRVTINGGVSDTLFQPAR